jgi:hypothetical protein
MPRWFNSSAALLADNGASSSKDGGKALSPFRGLPLELRRPPNRSPFDAAPWFSEADAESVTQLAQQGWSGPSIADALHHRPVMSASAN